MITEIISSYTETGKRAELTLIGNECQFSIDGEKYIFKIDFLKHKLKKHERNFPLNNNEEV